MLTEEQRRAAAESLLKSHDTKIQGERPSVMFPEIEIEDSYAISSMVAAAITLSESSQTHPLLMRLAQSF